MPQEPKKRHSRARQGKRRHALKFTHKTLGVCKNCGNKHVSHTVCKICGYYNGKPFMKEEAPAANNPQEPAALKAKNA